MTANDTCTRECGQEIAASLALNAEAESIKHRPRDWGHNRVRMEV